MLNYTHRLGRSCSEAKKTCTFSHKEADLRPKPVCKSVKALPHSFEHEWGSGKEDAALKNV